MPNPAANAFSPSTAPAGVPAPAGGCHLVCGDAPAPEFSHLPRIAADPAAVSQYADGSVDGIVVLDGLATSRDPIQTLRAWRRVLRENATLTLASGAVADGQGAWSAPFVLSLVQLVGGFETVPGAGPAGAVVFARRAIADVRIPLATLGPCLAAAANAGASGRCELLFQIGAVLLQCGEAELARTCFERMLRLEPSSAEAHFGLGMAYGSEQRWKDALCELECARRLDPHNPELQRWLDLARRHLGAPAVILPGQPSSGLPSAVAQKWSPAAHSLAVR